jgi:hypothetical protein
LFAENDTWIEFVTGQLQDFNQLEGTVTRSSLGISDDDGPYDDSEYYSEQSFEEYEVVEELDAQGDSYEYVLEEGEYENEEPDYEYRS